MPHFLRVGRIYFLFKSVSNIVISNSDKTKKSLLFEIKKCTTFQAPSIFWSVINIFEDFKMSSTVFVRNLTHVQLGVEEQRTLVVRDISANTEQAN